MADIGMTITLRAADDAVLADLALLEDATRRSVDVRNRLVDLLELTPDLVRIHRDLDLARSTGDVVFQFQLAEPFAKFVTALRAGEVDGFVVQDGFHG